ncbi:unnamed protein product [Effrenium voratum]|uniref:EF-hand domain-containing protein n=1 Tax=Effrenium voratum TaxID=2562239 RepID=A0AA36IMF5_9DINO|nr:unnamed protein product [Effrenium voratum]
MAAKGTESAAQPVLGRQMTIDLESVKELTQSRAFELGIGFVICCNMVLVVIETDANAVGDLTVEIRVAGRCFLAIYCLEAVVKIYALRLAYFCDAWNLLDFSLICLDMALTFLEVFGMTDWNTFSISGARIFRLARLGRVFRLVKQFWELKMLLLSFAAAVRSILWGMGMVLAMLAIWSILAVQLIHPVNVAVWEGREEECERCAHAFRSVWESHVTLFQTMIVGDEWGTYATPIIDREPVAFVYFLCVLVSVNMAMLNLILAVIVECAEKAKEKDIQQQAIFQEQERAMGKSNLLKLCRGMDNDGDGTIDLEELRAGFQEDEIFASCMKMMGVFDEDVELLFKILDTNGEGHVPYKDMVDTISKLKNHSSHVVLNELCGLRDSIANSSVDHFNRSMDERFDRMIRESNQYFDQILHSMSASTKLLRQLSGSVDEEPQSGCKCRAEAPRSPRSPGSKTAFQALAASATKAKEVDKSPRGAPQKTLVCTESETDTLCL